MSKAVPLAINGGNLFVHPLSLTQLNALIDEVEIVKKKNPAKYKFKNATKRLAAIDKLIFEKNPVRSNTAGIQTRADVR